MSARAMEICWHQVVAIRISRYSTNENRRLSKPSMTFIQVRSFDMFNKLFLTSNSYFLGIINCVRWSPSGDMLASASADKTVKLWDFTTGKVLHTGTTSDGSKLLHYNLHHLFFIIRPCHVSMLYLRVDGIKLKRWRDRSRVPLTIRRPVIDEIKINW